MKTKYYKAIAEAINRNTTYFDILGINAHINANPEARIKRGAFITDLCTFLAAENPGKFDEKKFRELLK